MTTNPTPSVLPPHLQKLIDDFGFEAGKSAIAVIEGVDSRTPEGIIIKQGFNRAYNALSDALAAIKASQGDARTDLVKDLANMHHDLIVVMQTAWIDWQRGAGAESAMQWIENTLDGPGLIPGADEPYANEPQAYFDKNKAEPFPQCFCGRPSNQLWMGLGFCGVAHYNEHRATIPVDGPAAITAKDSK